MKILLLASAAFLGIVLFLGISSTGRNGGDFTYPLDDSYIHLAVAKNLGTHGVWGINPDAFSGVSSSLSWPLALTVLGAAFRWGEWIPLGLNVVLGLWVLWLADRWLREVAVGRIVRAAALLGFVMVVPVGVLAFVGLEHVAQIGLSLALLRWAVRSVDGPRVEHVGRAMVLAALLVATRFEGLFLVAAIAFALRRTGRTDVAARMVLAALAPVLVFGLVSLALGGRFLPNPVWMKGRLAAELLPALRAAGPDPLLWGQLLVDFCILAPLRSLAEVGVLAWLVLFGLGWALWTRVRGVDLTALWIVLATTWMHLTFARTGWLGRYEAWLVAMLILVLAPFAQAWLDGGVRRRWWRRAGMIVVLTVFAMFPVRTRVASSLFQANRGSTNIHEQQIQMARFFREYRRGEAVGVNDIGAVGFFSGVECVDLWGLSDVEIAESRLQGRLNPIELGWLAQIREVDVVAMYESVLNETGGAPEEWHAIADWRIQRNAVCGSSRLTWYATSAAAAPRLASELRSWSGQLPSTVDVRWR